MIALEKLYSDLDFQSGELFSVADTPNRLRKNEWLEKGEWLSAAKRAGAEKVFFVENNPIAVFAACGEDHTEKIRAFNRLWSLARPRLLFLASPGEITVCDLAQKPFHFSGESKKRNKLKALATLHDIGKIAQKLQNFHRDNVESGKVFEKGRFGDLKNRADKSLIRDLKTVRRELIQAGLAGEKIKYAHTLIGRSIFIRYLEDRRILTEDYFRKVARRTAGWTDILKNDTECIASDVSEQKPFYPRILRNKDFTYALFRTLARDFNGDMFPDLNKEEKTVRQAHLDLVQDLLYGNAGIQKKLFFYSYRFDIVPLDLISSIYEEFYHPSANNDEKKSKARQDGAFYTPPALVEFVLSRILTVRELRKNPRVLDPACGSGIFLVEAFRRIARYKQYEKKADLSYDELKEILQRQISGIEVNREAARITVLSLYLSMLHYLDPPSVHEQIKKGNKLPKLIATKSRSQHHYHCIWVGNAYDTEAIGSNKFWEERFGEQCADVIVGNPPWGAPGNKADATTKQREQVMLEWCRKNHKTIGDKEPSQAFLWRSLDFLRHGGKAGMLVPAGVLFKHGSTAQRFREQWMDCIRLDEIFNFTHVRKFFFKGADSPFLAILFAKGRQNASGVNYWSAKQSLAMNKSQSVILNSNDMAIIRDTDLSDYRIWKLLTHVRHKDWEFINWLGKWPATSILQKHVKCSCVGFKKASQTKDAGWLKSFSKVKNDRFDRYDALRTSDFEQVPEKVEHRGKTKDIYVGNRLIIKEGISQAQGFFGRIIARYETDPYAFNHSFHVIQLNYDTVWKYKLVVGILWSSFARYYLFLTSANWGVWHDKILINERLRLPIVLDKKSPFTAKVISIVDKLRSYHPQKRNILHPDGVQEEKIEAKRRKWEAELDEAVFELYGLNEEQKDLISDCCEVTLPFFYRPFDSVGVMPAVDDGRDMSWIETYAKIFARRWNTYLGNGEEMRGEVHIGAHGNMLALEFFPADKDDHWNLKPQDDSWTYILEQIGKALPQPMGTSRIVLDGLIHTVSDNGIIIIKRNGKRFWTRSLAREDADATLCKAMLKNKGTS